MQRLFVLLYLIISICPSYAIAPKSSNNIEQDLTSTEGLMRLVPQLKNAQGQFEIPNPKKDVQKFLQVHHALTNIIEAALLQATLKKDLYQISSGRQIMLSFPSNWRSAEIGLMTDTKTTSFPDDGCFAAYGGISFLSGITPAAGTSGAYYQVSKPDGTIPALVYSEPTILPYVNRVFLAGANTAGIWMPPSYALGNKDGKAFILVDKCIDLGLAVNKNGVDQLSPAGLLFTAIHWVDTPELSYMRSNDKTHCH